MLEAIELGFLLDLAEVDQHHPRIAALLDDAGDDVVRPMTREHLLQTVWGYDYFGDVRTVDVTVRRLREKIEDNPSRPIWLVTRRGVGYYLRNPEKN